MLVILQVERFGGVFMVSDSEKLAARHADLVNFFIDNGYSVDYIDPLRYKVRGFGGLYIYNRCSYYCFSSERKGNAVDCLINELHLNFNDAVSLLLSYSVSEYRPDNFYFHFSKNDSKNSSKYVFNMPVLNGDQHRAIAYLTKVRKLSADVVISMLKRKLIMQTKDYGNIVFPYIDFNANIVGAEFVGTTIGKRFKKIDKNKNALSAYWFVNGQPDKLFVFESPIDMISFICLEKDNKLYMNDSIFVSMSGLKFSIVKEFYDHFNRPELLICVDNPEVADIKDSLAIDNFLNHFVDFNYIRLVSKYKDWNEDIKNKNNI